MPSFHMCRAVPSGTPSKAFPPNNRVSNPNPVSNSTPSFQKNRAVPYVASLQKSRAAPSAVIDNQSSAAKTPNRKPLKIKRPSENNPAKPPNPWVPMWVVLPRSKGSTDQCLRTPTARTDVSGTWDQSQINPLFKTNIFCMEVRIDIPNKIQK